MKMSKGIRAFIEEAKKSDSYWVEKAKLDFSLGLEKQRRVADMTYAAIAKKIGTSAAYITKVFRGDTNVTIETMVKLARSTGGQLDIKIVDAATATATWQAPITASKASASPITTGSTATVYMFPTAANSPEWERLAEAA